MRCLLLMACSTTALEFTVPARDGYKLSVVTSATTETDDAVLLLHGRTWSSGPVWQTTGAIDTLGRAAYAVDFRGFGRTLVAQMVAATSSVVDKLVLYSSVWDPEGDYADDEGRFKAPVPRGPQTLADCASDFGLRGSISAEASDAFAAAALEADPQCADWAALREFGVDLADVTCPTLVVHGDKDPYASIATQRALFNTLGSAEKSLVVIDASDHVAHALTRPKVQWAGAINAFLDA